MHCVVVSYNRGGRNAGQAGKTLQTVRRSRRLFNIDVA